VFELIGSSYKFYFHNCTTGFFKKKIFNTLKDKFYHNQKQNSMRRIIFPLVSAAAFAVLFTSCKKELNTEADQKLLSEDEKAMVLAAGFSDDGAEKTAEGKYLIEGDILLSKTQLQELAVTPLTNNFIVANEEHYRTNNIVSTPTSGARTITVSMAAGFPSHYYKGLDDALARYNSYGLKINFLRVASGGEIHITGSNLGTSGGGCILGQAAGFPNGGNPSNGFTLSTSSCATSYLNSSRKADEVIAHEIGHCIGFRHTDYMNRSSCGQNVNEGSAGVGAVHIPGTPTTVSGSYKSWMMACTDGSPNFSSTDGVALNYVY
jgi:Dual-action HEIGH metallo-peptidase